MREDGMSDITFDTICESVRNARTRNDAAHVYAVALCWLPHLSPNWALVNHEVRKRWPKGLIYVKTRAWKLAGILPETGEQP